MSRTRAAIVVGAAALGLAACGSQAPRVSTSPLGHANTNSTVAPTTTTTAPPASTTSTTAGGSTTTTGAATSGRPGRCHTSGLSAHLVRSGAAAGSIGQTIAFTNTTPTACTLYGYPGMAMLDAHGHVLPTTVHRGSSATVAPEAPSTVTLAPGKSASFGLGYADATGYSGATCPFSTSLEVTPPNAYHHLVIPDKVDPYGPCGKITVSPVYPGLGQQP